MSDVVKRLQKMSAVPGHSSAAFEDWLEQTETIQFLEQNARETEFVTDSAERRCDQT
jgi:hypothetical protein